MSVAIQIKKGDSRAWVFSLDDEDGSDLSLTGSTVAFQVTGREGRTPVLTRDTDTQTSDFIEVTAAGTGEVTVRIATSDWTAFSDYGIYIGEFRVTTAAGVLQYTQDVEIDVQREVF